MNKPDREKLEKAILGAKMMFEMESDGRRTRSELACRMYDYLDEVEVDRDLEYWNLLKEEQDDNE